MLKRNISLNRVRLEINGGEGRVSISQSIAAILRLSTLGYLVTIAVSGCLLRLKGHKFQGVVEI